MSGPYVFSFGLWFSLLTAVFLLVLTFYSWNRRSIPGALPFAVGSLLGAFWAAASVMEYAAVPETTKIFWYKAQAVLQLSATTAIAFFVFEYVMPGRWLTRRNLVLLSVAPLLFLILVLTNDQHQLLWTGFTVDGVVNAVLGPAAWVFVVYSYGLVIIELVFLSRLYQRSGPHRAPVLVMVVGQVGARVLYFLYAVRVVQSDLPLDILAMGIVFLTFAIALFAFNIFDPVSLARQSAFEQLFVGMLILDDRGRIASMNAAAERILGVSTDRSIGQSVHQVCPAFPKAGLSESEATELELSQSAEGRTQYCTVTVSPLTDWRGVTVGQLLLLRDVTDKRQSQAQIVEQQRALAMLEERARLARELHDTLGQVCVFVNVQGQTVRRLLERGEVAQADAHIVQIVEASGNADVDIREMILGLCASPLERGLYDTLTRYLTQYEQKYGVHVVLVMPESIRVGAFEPQVEVQLLRILQEALTNVRKHAGSSDVQVTFAQDNGHVNVIIQDNGHGFDPAKYADLMSDHVGLRVMRERAEEVQGSLNVDAAPGRGTRILVRVPLTTTETPESQPRPLAAERQV